MERNEADKRQTEDDVVYDRALERTLRMLRPVAASAMAPETVLVTMTVASLVPVLQATMSFVEATNRQLFAEPHRSRRAGAGGDSRPQ